MKVKQRKIAELIPAEYNPRGLTDKERADLRGSLERFGMVDPVIVNVHPDRKNIIVGGTTVPFIRIRDCQNVIRMYQNHMMTLGHQNAGKMLKVDELILNLEQQLEKAKELRTVLAMQCFKSTQN